MRGRRILLVSAATTAVVGSMTIGVTASSGAPAGSSKPAAPASATTPDYVVLYKAGVPNAAARAAIAKAGGTVVRENTKIGFAFVRSTNPRFASTVDASAAVDGAARNRVVGTSRPMKKSEIDAADLRAATAANTQLAQAAPAAGAAVTPEPLANAQWDMRQIGATATGSYAKNKGGPGVLVGVIDTGIDGSHPDIAANFNRRLSRNFTTDIPLIDGPCEHTSCVDPPDEDDDGHGTHVASTIGAPINGLGIAGVAPRVSLVNVRAGQDSGFFFLQATLDALTYAGDVGVDVVNMSYYTDPWLYNCLDNPADTPAEQVEQRVVRNATQRALDYAVNHGVLPISAEGNEATDLGNPTFDDTSPDFPPDSAHDRTVDNSCINVPAESKHVVTVSATGISTRKAYYSNYGTEQTDIAAPGGDVYDTPDNTRDIRDAVLAAMPQNVAEAEGDLNPDGTPNVPNVIRNCANGTCAYYQYLQGTSMAAPHAVGVAALIVSAYGKPDTVHGGLTLPPARTQALLYATAVEHACPQPRQFDYTRITPTAGTQTASAYCAGDARKNGFYGHGIVNAYAAVSQ